MRAYRVKVKLRERLEAAGVTQRQLASDIDMDASNVSEIVNGKQRDVQVTTALRIADALGVSVEDLFEVEEERTESTAA